MTVAQFSLDTVRALAAQHGYTEVQHNPTSRVVAFKRGDQRVNVYYTTGTVGTCLDHPKQGKTQLFRRGQRMADLKRIFRNPRAHTGAGYYRKHGPQRPEPSQRSADTDVCAFICSQNHLYENWDYRTVRIAAGVDCFFALQSDGSTWWGGSLPRSLHNKIKGRQAWLPSVDVVALDACNPHYYFVSFSDGKAQWAGAEDMTEAINEGWITGARPEIVCFAPHDGWYILWDDGSQNWSKLPRGLHNQLNGRKKSLPGVEIVSCGDDGEWFVRYLDGSTRMGGISHSLARARNKLYEDQDDILSVEFGNDDSWVIVYES